VCHSLLDVDLSKFEDANISVSVVGKLTTLENAACNDLILALCHKAYKIIFITLLQFQSDQMYRHCSDIGDINYLLLVFSEILLV
jgi:hypothetical protein